MKICNFFKVNHTNCGHIADEILNVAIDAEQIFNYRSPSVPIVEFRKGKIFKEPFSKSLTSYTEEHSRH